MKNLLFIGAGASLGARYGFPVRPPLGLELLDFLRRNLSQLAKTCTPTQLIICVAFLERAAEIVARAHGRAGTFEHFLPTLDPDDREFVHRALQIVFSDLSQCGVRFDLGFESRADGYDQLVSKLRLEEGSWDVISLNYDILFEEALTRAGIEFHFPHLPFEVTKEEKAGQGVRVHKPHGSINFFAQADHQISFGGLPEHVGDPIEMYDNASGEPRPSFPIAFAGMSGAPNVVHRAAESLVYPVIANYTKGKESDINGPTLAKVRKGALARAAKADRIIIIGVNPNIDADDDAFVDSLLRIPYPAVEYVGASAADGEAIKRRYRHAHSHLAGLLEYVKRLP